MFYTLIFLILLLILLLILFLILLLIFLLLILLPSCLLAYRFPEVRFPVLNVHFLFSYANVEPIDRRSSIPKLSSCSTLFRRGGRWSISIQTLKLSSCC